MTAMLRVETSARWEDLVLPAAQLRKLREIAAAGNGAGAAVQPRARARPVPHGAGVLFVGPAGTGKTMAAQVVAQELGRPLYRVELSGVVSRYIGETEKNLERVFDAAEESGAVLLIDEAEALFGKRSEVKDAHDRYANLEVAYLLQRIERFEGVTILSTNRKANLDPAFVRRLRYVVTFPRRGAAE